MNSENVNTFLGWIFTAFTALRNRIISILCLMKNTRIILDKLIEKLFKNNINREREEMGYKYDRKEEVKHIGGFNSTNH